MMGTSKKRSERREFVSRRSAGTGAYVEYVRIPSTAGAQIIEHSRFFEVPR